MNPDDPMPESSSGAANTPHPPNGSPPAPSIPDHQLLKRIGRGSYGEVWLARNIMGVYRAVKVVYRDSFREQKPFERELSGIRKFEPISRSHEGFIHILHVGINDQAQYFYYVMELGDDQTSGTEIHPENYSPRTLAKSVLLQGSLPLAECIQLGLALSLALSALHKHGLAHRDVKPSNIIFVNGVPKLADIGLVAIFDEARSYVGTEGFIPPEGPGSPQADIYSLGKTLYEVSTGKDRHDFPELPNALESLPDLGGFLEFNEVILQACKIDLTTRYRTAWDMHTDLVVLAAGKSVKRLKILERRLASFKRMAGVGALGFLVLAGIFYPVYRERKVAMEARQRRVGASIAYGNQALQSGDLLGSLPYFTEALSLDAGNPNQTTTHRLRIASVLAQCPKLTHVWSDGIRVNQAEFSPDGKSVLFAEFQGSVKAYDLTSGKLCFHPFGKTNWLWSAEYSPDGRLVVTANANGLAYVLDAANFEELYRLPHPGTVNSVKFSPDGLRILTTCKDGITRAWNLNARKVDLSLEHNQKVRFADFSPDGSLVATASEDTTARIWDARTGACRAVLNHPEWVNYVAFSPDNRRIVTAGSDHRARVWDLKSGDRIMPDLIHGDGVTSVVYSPDGRLILTASLDGTARLWLAETLQPLSPNPIIRHGERLTHAEFSRDGRQIITTGADGTIRIWDLAGCATPPQPAPYCFSEDGTHFLKATKANILEVRDAISEKPAGPVIDVAVSPEKVVLNRDGHFVAVVTSSQRAEEAHLRIYNTATGEAVGPGISATNPMSGAALSADGTHLLTFGGFTAQAWDVLKASAISNPTACANSITSASFDSSSKRFFVTSGTQIEVKDTLTGRPCFAPLALALPIHAAQFSRDGSKLVGCCWDPLFTKCYAQVWSATNGREIGPKLMHGDGVLDASFNPDGTRVVTASEDFTAIVWDVSTGRQLISPVEHAEKVRTAAFSPDGKWFVTASVDTTARVWNAETGDPLTPPLRQLRKLTDASFLADGRHIVTHDGSDGCRVWQLTVDNRPIEDLVLLGRLLSGNTEIRFGKISSRQSESLEAIWNRLRIKYPSTFETSAAEIEKWHAFQVEECELSRQWSAKAFHLKQLLVLRPGDPPTVKKP